MNPMKIITITFIVLLIASKIECSKDATETTKNSGNNSCGLNGLYDQSLEKCICYPAWTGPSCTTLNLVPMTPQEAESGVYKHGTQTSWGANVLYTEEDKLYHMFVSEMRNNCTLKSWIPNSMITHATSERLLGPYEFKETLFKTFHHNPRLTREPGGGLYLLFMIGGHADGTDDCSGIPDNVGETYDTRILVSTSKSLNGPWSDPEECGPLLQSGDEADWDYIVTNPSPVILDDGTTYLYYRGTPKYWNKTTAHGRRLDLPESVGLAIAPNFSGPYKKYKNEPILSVMNEDPFAWTSDRGFHMLTHGRDDWWNTHYSWSEDGLEWSSGEDVACDPNVTLTDGSVKKFTNRERPNIYFNVTTGEPAVLFNGVCPGTKYDYAYTIGQQINQG